MLLGFVIVENFIHTRMIQSAWKRFSFEGTSSLCEITMYEYINGIQTNIHYALSIVMDDKVILMAYFFYITTKLKSRFIKIALPFRARARDWRIGNF